MMNYGELRAERKAFEAWWRATMNLEEMDLHPFGTDQYACHETNLAWMTWQARSALAAPANETNLRATLRATANLLDEIYSDIGGEMARINSALATPAGEPLNEHFQDLEGKLPARRNGDPVALIRTNPNLHLALAAPAEPHEHGVPPEELGAIAKSIIDEQAPVDKPPGLGTTPMRWSDNEDDENTVKPTPTQEVTNNLLLAALQGLIELKDLVPGDFTEYQRRKPLAWGAARAAVDAALLIRKDPSIVERIWGTTESIKRHLEGGDHPQPDSLDANSGMSDFLRPVEQSEEARAETQPPTFKQELAALLNKYGHDDNSDMPDFILADMLIGFLETYNEAQFAYDAWTDGK